MISYESELLRLLLRQLITKNEEDVDAFLAARTINWNILNEFIRHHELAPFVYLALKRHKDVAPSDFMKKLEERYYSVVMSCQRFWKEFMRIRRTFEDAGVGLLPLKGIALISDVYRGMAARPMSDIDLLIREEDLTKSEEILSVLGYKKNLGAFKEAYWIRQHCHFSFYRESGKLSTNVDVHWALDFKRGNRYPLQDLWARRREVEVEGERVQLLSPEDTLFSLALHNRRFDGSTLCLKNAYDIMFLLEQYKDSFDWDYVIAASRKNRLSSTIFFSLCQVGFIAPYGDFNFIYKHLKIPRWKRGAVASLINKNTFLGDTPRDQKQLYLKAHFLLYDGLWEPACYIFQIPQEQFARFYNLEPYTVKTELLYRLRFCYVPFKSIGRLFRKLKR